AVTGNAVFGNAPTDSVAGLTTLSVSGTTAINTNTITTSGDQSYSGAVTLANAPTLSGMNVSFGSTVDGAGALRVNASGTTTFGGAVGGTASLTSVTTDAAGTTAINGGAVSTSGAQTYNDALTLGAD